MLQLQRASAGSGKTYTLAKKFIEYYISETDETGNRRLRPVRALRESLQHILAITFTNKATNEMKLRIVDKLNSLATWTPKIPVSKIDYLKDFTEDFHCSPQEIASVCKYALKVLLTDYGDFKVSTIDSFFQTVLRTFAYEADLDDTYQLELDSNYVAQMGLDTTLDEIDTVEQSTQGASWIGNMMENKAASGKGWNIFQKSLSKSSIYNEILNASKNLAKEDFKEIRESLDEYFEKYPNFFQTYNRLCEVYDKKQQEAFDNMREAAYDVRDTFLKFGTDIETSMHKVSAKKINMMAELWEWNHPVEKEDPSKYEIDKFKFKKTSKIKPSEEEYIKNHIEILLESFEKWRRIAIKWKIYQATLPYVGLLYTVRNNSRLYLTDSNTVELGETNSILSRIIGEDDAPFIYERLGSRLEHFLIDEFQDTSNLQWHNLRPLLKESESKGYDNLIIGDAKQSIYRFRNADPSLITTKVPDDFASSCRQCGNMPSENTNWRSSLRIVKFNNLFFRFFSKELGQRMERLYSNTVQPASHTEQRGYVKVQLFESQSGDDEIPAHFNEIPELIADMLRRGYEMSEIAILVDTHDQGAKVIESIMSYNLREDIEIKIKFISADSLQADESPAVQTVISILEAINNGTKAKLNPKEQRKEKGAGEWSKLRADFSFFSMQNQDVPLSELLTRFLEGEYNPDAIRNMLAEMSTTVLPALIENIIQKFIPPHSRQSETAFLSALQDMVLEYCEGHTSDIASFLQWWNKKGRFKSISSPEGTDAVNIMTVHKSKGLEFRCVIVPYSKQTIKPTSVFQKEWLWVQPDLSEAEDVPQIPWLPVWSEPKLEETIHRDIYREYLENYMTDKVNMAYVAYTRAIDELYIYTPCKLKEDSIVADSNRIGSFLWRCGAETEEIIAEIKNSYPDIVEWIPSADEITIDVENRSWSLGNKLNEDEIISGRKKNEEFSENKVIADYRCGNVIPALIFKDPNSPDQNVLPSDFNEDNSIDEQETEEMRRYGEIMHSIMEHINTAVDIPRALLRAKSAGLINRPQMEKMKEQLFKSVDSVKGYGWFAAGNKIINERGIVVDGTLRRPDRIIIRPDETAVIIDYKFGEHRNDKAYSKQVKRYAEALLKTGLAKKCEAYIWYVSLGDIVKGY